MWAGHWLVPPVVYTAEPQKMITGCACSRVGGAVHALEWVELRML